MADKLNDGGRGFNIVVLDPTTFEVIKVTHMDTYEIGREWNMCFTPFMDKKISSMFGKECSFWLIQNESKRF